MARTIWKEQVAPATKIMRMLDYFSLELIFIQNSYTFLFTLHGEKHFSKHSLINETQRWLSYLTLIQTVQGLQVSVKITPHSFLTT